MQENFASPRTRLCGIMDIKQTIWKAFSMSNFTLQDYLERLADPNPDVRVYTAWALGRMRDPRIIAPLITLLADSESAVRVRAAESLGNLRDETAIPPLMDALRDAEPKVRAQAAASLGRQHAPHADALVACLRDTDTDVRVAATEALGSLLDMAAVPPLIERLFADENENVRYYAKKSLQALGGEATVTGLIAHLDDGAHAPATKRDSAEIFAALRDPRAVAPLQRMADDPDEQVRETANWALEQLRG